MSIKGKLIGLVLLMSTILGLLAGYILWASYRIGHQVNFFVPAIGYLRGIADARSNITRQMKEAADFLVLARQADRGEFDSFGARTREAFELWTTSARTQQELGVDGEGEDLELAQQIAASYQEWETLMRRLFPLVTAGRRDEALRLFADRSDLLIEGRVLAGIDRALEDGLNEVKDAYNELAMSMGLLPWLARDGLQQVRGTQASIEYLMAVNRVSAGVNRQVKALLDYLLLGADHDIQFFSDYGKDTKAAIEACARAANRKAALDPAAKNGLLGEVVTIERSYGQILALAEQAIRLKQQGRPAAALQQVVEKLDPLLDAGLMPKIALALDDGGQEIMALSRTAGRQGVLVVVFLSGLIVAGSLRLLHELLRSLARLKTGIEVIGQGNLDYRIALGTSDEFGALADSFDTMVARLQQSRVQLDQFNAHLEQRVAERTTQLQTANRELESFSYSVSHDLRAPLSRVDAICQMLLEGEEYGDQVELRQALARIAEGTRQMDETIEALLGLAQVTSGGMQRETVDVSELVELLSGELGQRDPQRRVTFRIAPGIRGEGDRSLLLVALANLLDNAWKFTAERPEAVIEFGVVSREGQRTCFLRDNGAGFDPSHAERLFSPFQRLHETEAFSGTGIGLATVQRIIHRHGGRIWAEGEVGAGATFFFTLGPARANRPGADEPAAA